MRHKIDGFQSISRQKTLAYPLLKNKVIDAPEFIFDSCFDENGKPRLYIPRITFSDIHLGTHAARAKRLCKFLDNLKTDEAFLIGDIVDGIAIKGKSTYHFGGPWHKQVLGHFLRMASPDTQTKVTWVLGNHDHMGTGKNIANPHTGDNAIHRKLTGKSIMGIAIEENMIITDHKGRKIRISHGHEAESTPDFWYHVGDALHEGLLELDKLKDKFFPSFREHSIASLIKRPFKSIYSKFMKVIDNIEGFMEKDGADVQIYGHTHNLRITKTESGKLIVNDGCCTEHVQFSAQDKNGTLLIGTMYADKIEATDEYGRKYKKTWADLGIADGMKEAPIAHDDKHMENVSRLERLIYRAYPSQDKRKIRTELRERDKMTKNFNLQNDTLDAFEQECLDSHIEQTESLRNEFRKVPLPHARYQPIPKTNHISTDLTP